MDMRNEDAFLVRKICVLAGELLECYQWNEADADRTGAKTVIAELRETLSKLETAITKHD